MFITYCTCIKFCQVYRIFNFSLFLSFKKIQKLKYLSETMMLKMVDLIFFSSIFIPRGMLFILNSRLFKGNQLIIHESGHMGSVIKTRNFCHTNWYLNKMITFFSDQYFVGILLILLQSIWLS